MSNSQKNKGASKGASAQSVKVPAWYGELARATAKLENTPEAKQATQKQCVAWLAWLKPSTKPQAPNKRDIVLNKAALAGAYLECMQAINGTLPLNSRAALVALANAYPYIYLGKAGTILGEIAHAHSVIHYVYSNASNGVIARDFMPALAKVKSNVAPTLWAIAIKAAANASGAKASVVKSKVIARLNSAKQVLLASYAKQASVA